MPRKIEISHRTIIFTVLFLLGVWFVFYIRDIILEIFVALLIMTVLNPTVTKLQRYKVPRAASVLLVYAAVLTFVVGTVALLIPPLVEQTTRFTNSIPVILEQLNIPIFVVEQLTRELAEQVSSLPSQILKISVAVFSNAISVLAVMFFALYFLLAREKLDSQLSGFLSADQIKTIDRVLHKLEEDLGGWARGQFFVMVAVGTLTYIGLTILGVPFALPLALLAGILEIVPNFGPFLASVPPILVGFGISPFTGIAVAALAFLIQQLESYVLTPKVMEKSAKISPIVTLLALVVGLKLAGIMGAVLSIPIVVTSRVLITELVLKRKTS